MLRIICRTVDDTGPAHTGGPSVTDYRTFDVECPHAEKWLKEPEDRNWGCVSRSIVGVEVVDAVIDATREETAR